jgi:hypothetical protein
VVVGGGKEGQPDLVEQLLAYWVDCCPTWQAFKKDAFKNNCQIGQQSIKRLLSRHSATATRMLSFKARNHAKKMKMRR